ncbi:DEAD/DEAH box helicase [Vaginisenegalia massiliensis]|uniref:DEAD/DEAH box helicase n=1 Tax=Vaginisenegalia massiliensis TaxID=2058294 RepID=UPI000F52C8CD|nr:DEAD/DEAH box helicase [Vaginisenegalia massiliensis]
MIKNLKDALQDHWQSKGFAQATPIQVICAEKFNQSSSFVAISPTGTGKTLAYLLPLLNQIQANHQLQALILVPSQELAKQVGAVASEWGQLVGIHSLVLLGGANINRQAEALKAKPELIVATPGRLHEFMTYTRKIKLHEVKALIFDEADYLLEQEYLPMIQDLRKRVMRDTRCVWVSATLGPSLARLAEEEKLTVASISVEDNQLNLSHYYIMGQDRQKVTKLKQLTQLADFQAIVFFEQIHQLEEVAAKLTYQGVKVAMLHSQLSKQEREQAMRVFSQGQAQYLLTTDVAARGLDIPAIPYVIHFNRVDDPHTYQHRSGRTGRMGSQGYVLSLVNEQEWRDLRNCLRDLPMKLEQRYIYLGQLVTEEQFLLLREEQVSQDANRTPIKVKKKVAVKSKKTLDNKTKLKTKKRVRDQKNKGKRRVAKSE